MNNVFEKMNEKLVPIAMKISSNRYLTAIKEGFFGVMPIIIVGSIFLLLTSIPINGYEEFIPLDLLAFCLFHHLPLQQLPKSYSQL